MGKRLLQTLKSVAGAFFGVQSEEKRQQDFAERDPWKFVFAGVFLAVLLVVILLLIVRGVLSWRE